MEANPFTGLSADEVLEILEPGADGLKVLRIVTGIPVRIAGVRVAGWSTFAPK
jgi:hypothetical protein